MLYVDTYQSPLGEMIMLSNGSALTELCFSSDRFLSKKLAAQAVQESLPVFVQTKQWLDSYFSGDTPDVLPPISLRGTQFQQDVWQLLAAIPYGQLVTYGAIAKAVAQKRGLAKMSAQAVGGAVGHNPICIMIPCHRVVGSNGSLTGYAGGIDKKIGLLEHEGVDMQKLFVPKHGTAL